MNDRLTIQQGLFLCSNDVAVPLHSALKSLPNYDENVMQIQVAASARKEMLSRLHWAGVSRATLFPGLQGFAESLRAGIVRMEDMTKKRRSDHNLTGV